MSRLCWAAGAYGRYLEASRRPLTWVDRVESPMERAELLVTVAEATMETGGQFEDALQLSMRAREIARRINPHLLMHATSIILDNLYWLGRWDEIPDVLEEHLTAFEEESEVGCGRVRGGPLLGALLMLHRGDQTRAGELIALVPPLPGRRFEFERALYLLNTAQAEKAALASA